MVNLFGSDNLDEWLSWLETLHPRTIELGLDRVRQVAEKLNLFTQLKNKQATVITVAGTNGKGTCVATLQALLLAAKQSVGAYTSPHLLRYNERVLINGAEVTDQDLIAAFRQIESVRGDISLSYFEYGTLAAFLLFLKADVKYWLLEVGLGGRLDAVNLLDADIAVVTSIDLDHQDWLGETREQIALEKAGIYRRGKPAICVDGNPPTSLLEYAIKIDANLQMAGLQIRWTENDDHWHWSGMDSHGDKVELNNLPPTNLPVASISAALQAFALLDLNLDEQTIKTVVANVTLAGRCQLTTIEKRELLFDVAHNPAAASYLAQKLARGNIKDQCIHAVFSVLADKDIAGIIKPMTAVINSWHLAPLPQVSRAASLAALQAEFAQQSLSNNTHTSISEAITAAIAASNPGDRIVVFGSFYTVAEGLQWLQVRESSGD